ncbi:hypothetical protein PHLCEN_2v2728 [Hermanssonia centrifuga]|uniref:U3 small nucleolar RNA-associated protein 11 n=1 Tax=Hermanssonia centrifuga TaxID=98765 RepID=A0A2R6RHR7_9APHY|nr:hypothetical protein PHLCEN_2v2728 [Hermanssonia centrifuga]
MSSLRNSLHRRNHKERSQLSHRSRLGVLEKHKDYVLRARDYHSKQDRITRLRQKAAERNKDEFYFGMVNEKTERGVHVQDRGNVALPVDVVKVLKSQDENYMRTMRTAGLKKIDKLKSQLTTLADLVKPNPDEDDEDQLNEEELEVLRDAGLVARPAASRRRRKSSSGKHIIFADSENQARQYASSSSKATPDLDQDMEDGESDVETGWRSQAETGKSRSKGKKKAVQGDTDVAALEVERKEEASQHRTRLLKELSARLTRDKQLRYAEREMEMQKLLMGKGASRKMKGVERVEDGDKEGDESDDDKPRKKVDEKIWKPRVYKWRVERKR